MVRTVAQYEVIVAVVIVVVKLHRGRKSFVANVLVGVAAANN